jgi:hypothetical protein
VAAAGVAELTRPRAALLAALVLLAAPLVGQGTDTLRAVTLERRSVFDPSESSFWLLNLVNTLHITTRPYVIRREVLLRAGEPYDSASAAETARNLRRLGVFRLVSVDTTRTDSGLVATVTTRDGWSTRPDFRFRSTGGEIAYTLAMIEDNLLGTATQASLLYQKNPDRSTTTLGFRQPRLIRGKLGLAFALQNRSDGELAAGSFGQPFYTLASTRSWTIEGDTRRERVLRFREGIEQATDTLQRRYTLARGEIARALAASRFGYTRVGITGQLRRDDFATQAAFDLGGIGARTFTGAVGGYLEHRRARFAVVRGYNAQSRDEDIDLSTIVRGTLWLAPSALGYDDDGVAPGLYARTGAKLPWGFAVVEGAAQGLVTSAGVDSGSVQLAGTLAWVPSPVHLAVVHASAGMVRDPLPGSEFDLGLGVGPRAFRQHAFTGDRAFFTTAEYRWGALTDFLNVVDVGIAAFGDYGGAWYAGERRRTGWDVGVGLRLGASRAPDLEANRIDLAYRSGNDREPAGWVLVVAKGFTFSSGLRGR